MTKKPKLSYGIKGKLVSAVCMLLVAMIMVVSSTYAWFTLSTAPEVTGIQTAVGANGALEMALYTGTAPKDGMPATEDDVNLYWGNIVDLENGYGLDQITLYPSLLTTVEDNPGVFASTMLKTPSYGADGRVSGLLQNTVTGTLEGTDGSKAFFANDGYGVRAVGVASGMTERQLAYKNALSAASTAAGQAKTLAAQSLNAQGSVLANIAIKYGTSGTDAEFTQDDVQNLQTIVDDLLGKDDTVGILETIENAYMQYILAVAASSLTTNETAYVAVQGLIDAENATLYTVVDGLATAGAELPDYFAGYITGLKETRASVEAAQTALTTLAGYATDEDTTNDTIKWANDDTAGTIGIRTPLISLADPDHMKVNGIEAGKIREDNNMSTLVNSVASGGLVVTLATGGGVYADIADHCGDYTASVTIQKVEYGNLTLNNLTARMETASEADPNYLQAVSAAVSDKAPEGSADTKLPISEFYGYVIDLAFRTNAASSDLLLQTEAIDRIYGEDNDNEATMGHGANMTFKATTTDFSNEQVKALMACIRVVFFTPGESNNTVLAEARLDTANAAITSEGIQADLYLVDADGNFITDQSQAVIMALTQNTTTQVSALVYLDGSTITNANVAATAATSMTGSLNLQFSSSATLVPMEYAELHTPNGTATTTATAETTATPAP